MAKHLLRKLEQFTKLSDNDKQALERAAGERVRSLGPREDIIHEGDKPRQVNVILEGYACRYKVLEDGRRSIAAFLMPGDVRDLRNVHSQADGPLHRHGHVREGGRGSARCVP
jgi:CRP-like cAMP-binding protein